MSSVTLSAIPPQPSWEAISKHPLHLHCTENGQRIVYGTTNGIVARCLPDQVSFEHKAVETFVGSKRPITCAALSPNNRIAVGGDNDGNCYVWTRRRCETTMEHYKLDGLQYVRMNDVAVSPDGRRAALVGMDKYSEKLSATILLDSGVSVGTLTGHTLGIRAVHFRPTRPYHLATGGMDGLIGIHEGPPYRLKESIEAFTDDSIAGLRYNFDGTLLAVCSMEGKVALYDGNTYEKIQERQIAGNPVLMSLAWRPIGGHFVVVGQDKRMRVFEASPELPEIQVINLGSTDEDIPRGVVWSSRGWIVVAFYGGHLSGWKVPSDVTPVKSLDVELKQLEESAKQFALKQKAADGEQPEEDPLIETDASPTTSSPGEEEEESSPFDRIQKVEVNLKSSFTWYGPRGNPTVVDFDRETGRMIVGTSSGFVMFLDTEQTIPSAFQVNRLDKEVTVKSCLINQNVACAVTADGFLRFYRIRLSNAKSDVQFKVKKCLESVNGIKSEVTYSPQTRPELWMSVLAEVDRVPLKLVFLDNDKYVGLFCTDGTLFVYALSRVLQNSSPAFKTPNLEPDWSVVLLGKPIAASSTPDGSLLAIALYPSADYPSSKFGEGDTIIDPSHPLIEIYEIENAKSLEGFQFIYVLDLHKTDIMSISLSEDGSLLASVDKMRNIRVIMIETKADLPIHSTSYHSTKVLGLDWSPNGTSLASISADGIYVRDVDSGDLPLSIQDGHTGSPIFVKFLFNNILLTAGADGIMKVHELEMPELKTLNPAIIVPPVETPVSEIEPVEQVEEIPEPKEQEEVEQIPEPKEGLLPEPAEADKIIEVSPTCLAAGQLQEC